MSIPSNLYAEKVFAEQPLAVWPLDDKLDYISLMSDSKRNLLATSTDAWTLSNCSVALSTTKVGPIEAAPSFDVTASTAGPSLLTLTSSNLFSSSGLNSELGSFSISTYIYRDFSNINSIRLGYQVGSGSVVFGTAKSLISGIGAWALISETFSLPQGSPGQVKAVIEVSYALGPSYEFTLHGITVGQWSEVFQRASLGIPLIKTPLDIAISETDAVPASSYGLGESSGYYLAKGNKLGAKNFGTPLAYGSPSVTSLNPIEGPSVIFPGFGFLNESGQYRDLTLEFWLRVDYGSLQPRKICGPLTSTDGIYVDGAFLKIKINNSIGSYFVGEWSRPMLIDFSIINNSASLLINGEQAISLSLQTSELTFPDNFDSTGRSQDWLGFYSYEDLGSVQIDAVAIYPYQVSGIVAKRRFVYGQGVEIPQNINSSYSTSSIVVDYAFANYANNYNYPSIGSWARGVVSNLSTEAGTLSSPEYSLPNVVFQSKTAESWKADLATVQTQENSFISLRPGTAWSSENGHLIFSSINTLSQKTRAIYGIFVKTNTSTQKETLFRILDSNTQDYLDISLQGTKLVYAYYSSANGQEQVIKEFANVARNNEFAVGLDIEAFSKNYGSFFPAFFNDGNQLVLYVGGTREFSQTFSGNIYNVSFCNSDNFAEISAAFSTEGMLNYKTALVSGTNTGTYSSTYGYFSSTSDYWTQALNSSTDLFGRIASYTLILNKFLSSYFLDISVSGYWTDYIPLTYFSKYVTNSDNERYYSLDFIQLNLDSPRIFSNGQSQENVKFINSYVTFQSLKSNAYQPKDYYTYEVEAQANGVIEPGYYPTEIVSGVQKYDQWSKTKYGFENGSVVYPPVGINIQDVAIGIHLEFNVKGILNNPVKVRSLETASQAYNDLTPTGIPTKNGIAIFPYTKNGIYFDYKKKNPISIYKGSTPHLYLTSESGVKLLGNQKIGVSRGVSMPINQSSAEAYTVGAMQFFAKYEKALFPVAAEELFEIEAANKYIKFYIQATDATRKRGKVYAFNTVTGQVEQGISYSISGQQSLSLILESGQWMIIGIQFSNNLNFGNVRGAFRLTGPILVDNVSHYKYTAAQENQISIPRPWSQVLAPDGNTEDWDYWESDFVWEDVLYVLSFQKKLIDLQEIYKAYVGTNKTIVSDESVFSLNSYEYRSYDDVVWQIQTTTAV